MGCLTLCSQKQNRSGEHKGQRASSESKWLKETWKTLGNKIKGKRSQVVGWITYASQFNGRTSERRTLGSQFSSVQSLRRVRLSVTPWTSEHQASLSITNSRRSFRLMSIKSVMASNHLIPCHSLLLLPPIPPSIRVFSSESGLRIRWPKYWSFSFSISPCNEYSGPISFRMDWLDLLAVQGTLKSLLQHHSSKASILR